MTMRKKAAALVYALFILLTPLDGRAENPNALRLTDGEDFSILILADVQDTAQPQKATLDLLNAALDAADPDLAVFLGDMIHGPAVQGEENVRAAIDAIVRPVAERGIPFALVFGNHDAECGWSSEELLALYQTYPGCLAAEGEGLPGCGNYYLLLENPAEPESPFVLWFLDSGTLAEPGRGTYGYVTQAQNEWMLAAYAQLTEQYAAPASYAFQHIPVPQVYELVREVPFGTPGAVLCSWPRVGKWFVPDETRIWAGRLGEGSGASEYDSGEFAAWQQMGLRAAFFGHDHLNDCCGTYAGIDLIATTSLGFYMYGRGDEHGARLLVLHPDRPLAYDTRMLYYRDIVDAPLPGPLVSSLGVMLTRYVLLGAGALALLTVFTILLLRRKKRRARAARLTPEA